MCPYTHTPQQPLWTPCEVRSTSAPVAFCPMVSCWADISVCSDDSLTWCLFGLATCFHLNQYTAQRKEEVERGGEWPSGTCTHLPWHEEHGSTVAWKRERKVPPPHTHTHLLFGVISSSIHVVTKHKTLLPHKTKIYLCICLSPFFLFGRTEQ